MFELNCLYPTGEKVIAFVQWDLNQTIIIDGTFTKAPTVHFCNKNSEKALCVRAVLMDTGQISVEIPNTLLIEPYPISIYIYQIETKSNSGRTILKDQIQVIPRIKPDDFEYKENYHIVYLTQLEEQIIALNNTISAAENIRLQNEQNRIDDENERKSEENNRIQNEVNRQQNTAVAIENCETATENATTAANAANNAADRAMELVYGNLSEKTVTFTEATTRGNISSGENLSTLFGKIQKYFNDMGESAFYDIANNLTTTTQGFVLDARQGKALKDTCTSIENNLSSYVTEDDINEIFSEM